MEYLPSYIDSIRADIQPSYTDSLTHHGIKGMHWGVRRYQNVDGSLTNAGKKKYSLNPVKRLKQKRQEKQKIKNEQRRLQQIRKAEAYKQDKIVNKHIKWDKDGNITSISKKLEKALDAPLDMIDDEDLIYTVAMELD